MRKKYFILYSCCIPVSGIKRAVICDLQRDKIYPIPLVLYKILNYTQKGKSILEIKNEFEENQYRYIDDYFDHLSNLDCGFFSDTFQQLPKINFNNYYDPKPISNAIVDFSTISEHDFSKIILELSHLKCEALEMRFYKEMPISNLTLLLSITDGSTLRSIEILVKYDMSYSTDNIIKLRKQYSRLRKLTLFEAYSNKILEHPDIYIIYAKQSVLSEKCCGNVSPWYFIAKTENFIEAKKFNSCLNRKLSIDQHGNIKNCPSMKFSYGNIKNVSLLDVVNQKDFSSIWNISKDKIQICKDCEYRYVCQDCRAYVVDDQNIYSKPIKCTYNPYE
jgi:SPASM domain peptide maturase of grasp-with-spasm system